jgi:hypothetical protein
MKKTVIDRYEKTDKNEAVIDVSIPSVDRLYHNFDKTAPYHRKELDEELVDYITECVQELGKYPFIIRISLETMPVSGLMERVQNSINNYYIYLREIEMRSMKRMFRRFGTLFAIGLMLLVLAIIAARRFASGEGVMTEVFVQGLTIAAWISLWESVAGILLEWRPCRENIRLCNRIIAAPVIFRQLPPAISTL